MGVGLTEEQIRYLIHRIEPAVVAGWEEADQAERVLALTLMERECDLAARIEMAGASWSHEEG